ncbi:uncharacterized protein [Venturia canescens]|uniref:uncharacterized protein n=1 Tax=Venturia canescens TaxID=32260 RepID=UPI001C9C7C11|nr:uncharacterized protein LOC122410899 [Venturia canescens]
MTAALYPAEKNSDRTSSYPHYSTIFNFQGINFPMTLDQIGKFEKMNNLSINVYSEKEEVILPVRVSKEKKERHFNLLYIEDVSGCGIGHFAWIKNLSRLVNSQLNSDGHKKYICDRCLHYFPTIDKLQFHEVDCGVINDCAVRLPAENDKWLEFTNANRKERLPFVVYADLECILEKTSAEEREKNKSQHHRVFSVGYYVKCSYDDSLSGYHERRGEDCVEWFVEELKQLALRSWVPRLVLHGAQISPVLHALRVLHLHINLVQYDKEKEGTQYVLGLQQKAEPPRTKRNISPQRLY